MTIIMEILEDDTVSSNGAATGTATTINTMNDGEQQQQQQQQQSRKKGGKKSTSSATKTKRRKASADAAWTRLYSATTAAQNAGKWNVYKRTEEEKKRKIIPKDNAFLAYGEDVLSKNPKRKQSAPTIPRKRPEKVYTARNRDGTFAEITTPKTSRRRMSNRLNSSSSVASLGSNTSYSSRMSQGSRSTVASRQSRKSTSSAPARMTRSRSVAAPPRVASITSRSVRKTPPPASARRKTPPRTSRSKTTPNKKTLTKSKSTPNDRIIKNTRPPRARRTKSEATIAKKMDNFSAEEESTIATNENDNDTLLELELDAILDDDDDDDQIINDDKPVASSINDNSNNMPPPQKIPQPQLSVDKNDVFDIDATKPEDTTDPEVVEEVQEKEEVHEDEASREIEVPEEVHEEALIVEEEANTTYIDENSGDDSFNNKLSLSLQETNDDGNDALSSNDVNVVPPSDNDVDVHPPNENNANVPFSSSDAEVDDVVDMSYDDSIKPDANVVIGDTNDDTDPFESSSFIDETGTGTETLEEEEAAEEEELEPTTAFEELVPNTPPSKKSAEEPPTSIGKPSLFSAAATTHAIPMSPLTPDIRNVKLRSAEIDTPSPETDTMNSTKLRSVELNNSPIPNIANIIDGSNNLRSCRARRKKREPKIFGKEWLLNHWNRNDADKDTPCLLVIPEREELESLFRRIDENLSGKITKVELHTAVQILYPEEEDTNTKDAAFNIALESIVTEDENALEQEEFSYFIHYMVYYHNLSIPFEFAITNGEEYSSFTITHYKFTMVSQDIIWSNLLLLKDRNEEMKTSDLFDILAVNEENNTNEDDNKIIHFDSLCKYLAMKALKDIEEELYHERHSSDDDDDVEVSSEEEAEDDVANDINNNDDDNIDASEGGLFHEFSGTNNLSMESVDENQVSLHTLDINGKDSDQKKKNSSVQNRMAFFEQQQKTQESEFVNQRRRSLFKPKTWRKSFYKNQFIAKANAEQKKVQADNTDD